MARVFIWLLRSFIALVMLTGLTGILVYWLATRSVPDYSTRFQVSGLTAPVEIVRNNANVPHIFGQTDEDVLFGLGFAHAQDRLWQMTLLRRTAQGRLSELFGQRAVQTDDLLRRLDLYNLAVRSVDVQDAATKAGLNAYAAGVNAWLTQINARALGRGAPEFFLFSNAVAPWQPADSIAVGKLMALRMTEHLEGEVLRARLSMLLPDDRVRDLMPDIPGAGVAELPKYAELFSIAPTRSAMAARPFLSPARPRGLAGASNGWAAAPSRSATGSTLLAGDLHADLSAPTVWYLARLDLATGAVIGATFPGIPAILLGRNENIAWSVTAAHADDQDIFIERINPDAPEEYLTPDGFRPFETRQSVISIRDGAPATLTLRWTENGPVLPGGHFNLHGITPPGHVAALSWTGLSPHDTSLSGFFHLMQAQSVQDALQLGSNFIAPAQNLIVADAGRIALQTLGVIPRRSADHQTQGRMPAPGWRNENRWRGRLNYAANPSFVDPVGGIVGNTNNKILDRPFPLHVSHSWGDSQRVQRWRRLMQAREVHTRESFVETQLDTVSITARNLLPLIARDLWFEGQTAAQGTPERRRQRALQLLADWNGEMNEHLPEPLIYAAWLRALNQRLIQDELGPLSGAFTHADPLFVERVFRDVGGAGAWCDVIQSTESETCTQTARVALDSALLELTETYGENIESWRWGDAHQAKHDHAVLGELPILSWLVNIRQSTSGGDHTLQRARTSGDASDPYANVHASGYRGVYDLADPDSSLFITATGQSGHPLSRHYDDLGELWRRGEYIPMSLDPALARAAAVGVTHLEPMQ